MSQIDPNSLVEMSEIKTLLEQMAKERKIQKSRLDNIKAPLIEQLINLGVRYIDESGRGVGPYHCLVKDPKESSLNEEKSIDFYNQVLTGIYERNERYTGKQVYDMSKTYLKQFQERKLNLKKNNTVTKKGIDDLLDWIQHGDRAP